MLTPFSISNLTKSTRSKTKASSIACSSEPTYGAGSGTRQYTLGREQHQLLRMLQAATGLEAEKNAYTSTNCCWFTHSTIAELNLISLNFCFFFNVASVPPKKL